MAKTAFSTEQLKQAVDPEPVERVCDTILETADSTSDDLNKLSQAIVYHRFIRFQITDSAQGELKPPEVTATEQRGGRSDQVVLLASMLLSKGITCRILKASTFNKSVYTLEVLVDNESETQAVGVDAKQEYRFKESNQREGLYWTPADPQLCPRPGKLGDLKEEDLITKKSENGRRLYEWRNSEDSVTICP
ncbi:hypothetical protein [Natrinema sp. H-ect4]|uniref:hypothetical protein n=1 Tax=Natrinema sp. H-ect4 TaxID=3242699 RepID=UPI0035A8C413